MTDPHVGREVDSFDFRTLLERYGFTPRFIGSEETEVLLDATLVEALSLMRERGYIDEKFIFVSKGNGIIGIRDTSQDDNPDDLDQ
jgi:hypothetical protein